MRSDPPDPTIFMPPAVDYPLRTGPAEPLGRRGAVCLALLVLLALLPRLCVALRLGPVCDDGYFYLAVADAYERGDLETALWYLNINVYPVLLAGFSQLGLDPLSAAKVWGVTVATLTVLPLFGWLRRLLDFRSAVAACGLYAVHPEFIEISPEPIRDSTFWLFSASTLYFLWRAASERKFWIFTAGGIAFALAAHTRSEGWLFALPAIAWPIVYWGEAVRARWKLVAGTIMAFSMTPLLVIGLNVTVLQHHSHWEWGKLEHFSLPYRLIAGSDAQVARDAKPVVQPHSIAPADSVPRAIPRSGLNHVAPALIAELQENVPNEESKISTYFRSAVHALEPVTLFLMLLGAIAGRRLLLRREHLVLSAMCASIVLGVWVRQAMLGEINGRYFLACFFPASGAAGLGAVWVLSKVEQGWAARLSHSRAAIATATVAILIGSAHVADVVAGEHPSREREAKFGRLLGEQLGRSRTMIVLPHASRVGYYAGGRLPVVALDDTPIESLLARHGAEIVILEHGYTPASRCAELACRLIAQGWRPLGLANVPESESFLVLVGPSTSLASAGPLKTEESGVR